MKNLIKKLFFATLFTLPLLSNQLCNVNPEYDDLTNYNSLVPEKLMKINGNSNTLISGYIWYDKDLDGIQDYGEIALQKIRVKLYKDGVDTGIMVESDKNGIYRFENLEANHTYQIEVLLPRNYKGFTVQNAGNDDTIDSDVDGFGKSDEIFLKAGQHEDIDVGMICRCIAWIDVEKFTNDKDADYIKDAPVLKAGDSVTWKYVISNTSKLKVCDIKLIDDKEGEIDCPSSCVDAGSQMVCIKEGIVKEGNYENMATVSGKAENNQTVTDKDPSHYVGQKRLGCIGNFYWFDENLNGMQDSNEGGIAGIKVELYDENKQKIATTYTDNNGKYLFCELEEGNYYVKFDLPSAYLFTPKNKGNDFKDSDANSNGWSDIINFTGENDLTIDAGIYCSCDDYLVNPQNYKKLKASIDLKTIFIMILFVLFATSTLKRSRKNRQ
jgi:hypothetical protein